MKNETKTKRTPEKGRLAMDSYAKALATATVTRETGEEKITSKQYGICHAERLLTRAKPKQRKIIEENIRAMKREILDLGGTW